MAKFIIEKIETYFVHSNWMNNVKIHFTSNRNTIADDALQKEKKKKNKKTFSHQVALKIM